MFNTQLFVYQRNTSLICVIRRQRTWNDLVAMKSIIITGGLATLTHRQIGKYESAQRK